jgi:hypothetical protein
VKNEFCDLPQAEIFALNIPLDMKGFLLSPFHLNQQNGYVLVPAEAFKELIDLITEYAILKDGQSEPNAGKTIAS